MAVSGFAIIAVAVSALPFAAPLMVLNIPKRQAHHFGSFLEYSFTRH